MIATAAVAWLSWGQIALVSGVLLAIVKLGDRLWGRRPNGLDSRVAKLEAHDEDMKVQIKRIDDTVTKLYNHFLPRSKE